MQGLIAFAGAFVVLLAAGPGFAEDAKAFFDDNCAMCHSIGGEPSAGPDLRDITTRREREWLVRFIHDPREAAEHDPEAAVLVRQYDDAMPATEGASRELIHALLRYIEAKSATANAGPAVPPAGPPLGAGDIALGRELYEGRQRLANGAPSCVSCHRLAHATGVAGGRLGPDLTGVDQRLGGTRGVSTWMRNPPTPVMRAVYRHARPSEQEAQALGAFLGAPVAAAKGTAPPYSWGAFLMTGATGFFVSLVVMGAAWSGRLRAVRRPLVAAGGAQAGGKR
jgi:cytochrome c2